MRTSKERTAAVITAMRAACNGKEQLTAAWLSTSTKHRGLYEALKAVFKTKPTTQKLGIWLRDNAGTRVDDLQLIGTHSASNKAWRYKVYTPTDAEEPAKRAAQKKANAAAKLVEQAERAARNTAAREAREAKKQADRDDVKELIAAIKRPGPPIPSPIDHDAEALATRNKEARALFPVTQAQPSRPAVVPINEALPESPQSIAHRTGVQAIRRGEPIPQPIPAGYTLHKLPDFNRPAADRNGIQLTLSKRWNPFNF